MRNSKIMHASFFPLYGGQIAFYLQCALRQPNEVSSSKIIKQHFTHHYS